jgi:hypothetical protein
MIYFSNASFVRCWETNFKLSSDGDDSGSKQCKEGWCLTESTFTGCLKSAFGGSLESRVRRSFCVGVFGRNLASDAVSMLSHLI